MVITSDKTTMTEGTEGIVRDAGVNVDKDIEQPSGYLYTPPFEASLWVARLVLKSWTRGKSEVLRRAHMGDSAWCREKQIKTVRALLPCNSMI